jgi:hypothetical protein
MIYIYDNNTSEVIELAGGGFTTQYEHIKSSFEAKGWEIEHFNVDLNEDAKAVAEQYNLTVFPVLFELANDPNGVLVLEKLAEGLDAILLLSDDTIRRISDTLTKLNSTTEPAKFFEAKGNAKQPELTIPENPPSIH